MAEELKEKNTKYCKHCAAKIPFDAVICTKCGRQVEEIKTSGSEPIIINNNNTATAITNVDSGRRKNKWVAFFLCLFLGEFGVHKFYEGKVGLGILYLCTFGLFYVGVIVDLIILLFRHNPYYV